MRTDRCGFTLVETAAVLAVTGVLTGLGLVVLGQPGEGAGVRDRQAVAKDISQVRGIHQAMVVWAQNNKDQYPLPSVIDIQDATVAERGPMKDTTANILSLMVFNGAIGTEMLVSPLEVNANVVVMEEYHYSEPPKAVKKEMALWDPSLRASFGVEKGHISYAHLQPIGARKQRWANTFSATEVVLGTRGPEVKGVVYEGLSAVPTFADPASNALRLLGDGVTWRGHLAFNDNHIDEKAVELTGGKPFTSETLRYKTSGGMTTPGTERADVIFFDDPDDSAHANTYMGVFTRAGQRIEEWKGIWD